MVVELIDHARATLDECSHSMTVKKDIRSHGEDSSGTYHAGNWVSDCPQQLQIAVIVSRAASTKCPHVLVENPKQPW
jgi:hypothetical protein